MSFSFTDEQTEFRSILRRFLADKSPTTEVRRLMETEDGYDPDIWRQLSQDLGVMAIHIPEEYGGQGFGFLHRPRVRAGHIEDAAAWSNVLCHCLTSLFLSLLPGKDRLFQMIDPDVATGHHHLGELIDYHRCWRIYLIVTKQNTQDRAVAFGNGDEFR